MKNPWVSLFLRPRTVLFLAVLGLSQASVAQRVPFALLEPGEMRAEPVPLTPLVKFTQPTIATEALGRHRFWDRENSVLFAANSAFSAADFVVTRQNLRNGGQELNPLTRQMSGSTAGLAVNFAGEAVGVVGVSYLLHKTGHHKLERAVSMLNLGSSAAAVSFGLAHR